MATVNVKVYGTTPENGEGELLVETEFNTRDGAEEWIDLGRGMEVMLGLPPTRILIDDVEFPVAA
jgi:hypothetical protein